MRRSIQIDGYDIDYPDDNVSQRFRRWIILNRAVEHAFVTMALQHFEENKQTSGYSIVQDLRRDRGFRIMNDFGPLFARLAVAKHPQLRRVFRFKPTGWGRQRKQKEEGELLKKMEDC